MEQMVETQRHPWRLVAWLVFVLFLTGINVLGRLLGDTPENIAYRWSTSVNVLIQFGVMLGVLLLITMGLRRRYFFALHRPRSWKRAGAYAAAVLVAIWAVQITYVLILAAFGDFDPTKEQGLVPEDWDPDRAAALFTFAVLVSVVVPVVEELTFRGVGMTLAMPWGTLTAVLLTGTLFGLAHGLLLGLPALVFFGFAVGWLRVKTESVYPCMLVHSAYNTVALAFALGSLG